MAEKTPLLKAPSRLLFIASIGNKAPYRTTRHSAGHILLDALVPILPSRLLPSSKPPLSSAGPTPSIPTYKTWSSPSYMNESGPKLVRQLDNWITTHQRDYAWVWKHFSPTLVILHDELEAPLGKLRVRRGGPEQASLRGHRGLISVMESLRGKGLLVTGQGKGGKVKGGGTALSSGARLSILRVGVGIGRPSTRERGDVADYVLAEMTPVELNAVRGAAGSVADVLMDELYRSQEVS